MPLKGVHIKGRSAEGVSEVDIDLERALNVWEMTRMNGVLSELFHYLTDCFLILANVHLGCESYSTLLSALYAAHSEISPFTPLVEQQRAD